MVGIETILSIFSGTIGLVAGAAGSYFVMKRRQARITERRRATTYFHKIHNRFTPQAYVPVRTDEVRRVVAVRLEKPSGRVCTRLYHWDVDDDTVCQKFTTGQPWGDLVQQANTQLGT